MFDFSYDLIFNSAALSTLVRPLNGGHWVLTHAQGFLDGGSSATFHIEDESGVGLYRGVVPFDSGQMEKHVLPNQGIRIMPSGMAGGNSRLLVSGRFEPAS